LKGLEKHNHIPKRYMTMYSLIGNVCKGAEHGNGCTGLGAGAIYVADSRIFDFFPGPNEVATGGVLDLSYHVLTRMAGHMKAYESGEFSMDIGTFAAYEKAQRLYPSGK
jgi:NDP-sugar pyrophosphorylase family protein